MKFDYRTLASNLFIYVFRMLPYVLFCFYNCIPKLRVIKENMHHFAVCVVLYAFSTLPHAEPQETVQHFLGTVKA